MGVFECIGVGYLHHPVIYLLYNLVFYHVTPHDRRHTFSVSLLVEKMKYFKSM